MRSIAIGIALVFVFLTAQQRSVADEAPILVSKDRDRRLSDESLENIAKLRELIVNEGSVTVWITLDPEYVGFVPEMRGIDEKDIRAQNRRVKAELDRILFPLFARSAVEMGGKTKSQFGTSGLVK